MVSLTRRGLLSACALCAVPLAGAAPLVSAHPGSPWEHLLLLLLRKDVHMGPSLLMAILAPSRPLSGVDAMDHVQDEGLEGDVRRWIHTDAAKRALMVQALYQALPYALADEAAARFVGRVLARAVEGGTSAAPPDPDGLDALRRELREHLKAQFEQFKATIP